MTKLKITHATYGIFWKITSCACFAAINGVIKLLTVDLPVNNILFWQNFLAILFLLPFFIKKPSFRSNFNNKIYIT